MQKQLAFMLGRQQVFLELNENMVEYDDLVEIMSNAHLNNHFLNLAREVSCLTLFILLSGQMISISTSLYWYNLGHGFVVIYSVLHMCYPHKSTNVKG